MRIGVKILLVCAVVVMASSGAGVLAAPPLRSVSASRFALEIDGSHAGFLSSVEGGLAFGDVVKLAGEDFFLKKHLGNAGYRDIRIEFGADMDKTFYNWIALALQGQPVRLSGAILSLDFNYNVVSRLEFQRAQITEVTFPAVDGASKEPGRLSMVLTPAETFLNRKASGKISANSPATQKKWLTSNFRIAIDGLDAKWVTKIEALTIKLPRSNFGDDTACLTCEGIPAGDSTKIDFPNVVMTVGGPSGTFNDWFDDFVIAGNNDDSHEKGGTLEFLTPNLQTPLFTLSFKNLGIFETMPVVEPNAVTRLLVAMYCESMEFVAH